MNVASSLLCLVACATASSASATTVSPDIEGTYSVTVTCPAETGAPICRQPGREVALTIVTSGGKTQVGIADKALQTPFYSFTAAVDGATLSAGADSSVGAPASLSLSPSSAGNTLTGTILDPSTVGAITVVATPTMTLTSCLQGAAAWPATGADAAGTYAGMVNAPNGPTGSLIVQQSGGNGLSAAFVASWAPVLYFDEIQVGPAQTVTAAGNPGRWDDGFIKWCLASRDGKAWNGFAYGTNGYAAALAFSRN